MLKEYATEYHWYISKINLASRGKKSIGNEPNYTSNIKHQQLKKILLCVNIGFFFPLFSNTQSGFHSYLKVQVLFKNTGSSGLFGSQ